MEVEKRRNASAECQISDLETILNIHSEDKDVRKFEI